VDWSKLKNLSISRSGDRAPRYNVETGVTAETIDKNVRIECFSINISRSGILLVYQGHFWPKWQEGDEINVAVDADGRYVKEKFSCKGKIIRIEQTKEASDGELSVRFALHFDG